MAHIRKVEILENYQLLVFFESGEQKIFDLKPYLNKGIFKQLKNYSYLATIKNRGRFVEWPNEQDLSADTLYIEGKDVRSAFS
jgi:hypothetical protein